MFIAFISCEKVFRLQRLFYWQFTSLCQNRYVLFPRKRNKKCFIYLPHVLIFFCKFKNMDWSDDDKRRNILGTASVHGNMIISFRDCWIMRSYHSQGLLLCFAAQFVQWRINITNHLTADVIQNCKWTNERPTSTICRSCDFRNKTLVLHPKRHLVLFRFNSDWTKRCFSRSVLILPKINPTSTIQLSKCLPSLVKTTTKSVKLELTSKSTWSCMPATCTCRWYGRIVDLSAQLIVSSV